MKQPKHKASFSMDPECVEWVDGFALHLSRHTGYVGISRSSVTEMLIDLASRLLPQFPASSAENLKPSLTEQEQVFLRELSNYVEQ